MSDTVTKAREFLEKQIPIAPLVIFRVLFAAILVWEVYRYFIYDRIFRYYIQPKFHFTYYGFDWVSPLAGYGMYILWIGIAILALLMGIGLFYRLAALGLFITLSYVFLLDVTQYLNHFYLVAIMAFLMMFIPAHRYLSFDSLRKPEIKSMHIARGYLYIIIFQLAIVYFYGAIAKINYDWLVRAEPLRNWLGGESGFAFFDYIFQFDFTFYFFSYSGLVIDFFAIPGLLWKRSRILAMVVLTSFHLTNAAIFSIGIFPWFMIATLVLFVEPEKTHRVLQKLIDRVPAFKKNYSSEDSRTCSIPNGLAWFMAIFFFFQMIVPLRHHLYPGNPAWTDEGHRFSWRMKLRSKSGRLQFRVTDKASGKVWSAPMLDFLGRRQIRKMSTRPDMILQFARYLKRYYLVVEGMDTTVNVLSMVSLNSREPQPLIDPNVDLASQTPGLGHKTWILPLKETP